jgi:hypothetical protein
MLRLPSETYRLLGMRDPVSSSVFMALYMRLNLDWALVVRDPDGSLEGAQDNEASLALLLQKIR